MKRLRILTLAAATSLLPTACGVNPVTGQNELRLVSEREEIEIGKKNYGPGQQQAGGEFILDPALTGYVRGVFSRITQVSERPNLPYELVIANDSTPNAWAMPGGKLVIHRGLLTELKSEAELAAVLSHEVVHAAARHSARQMESSVLIGIGVAVLSAAADSKHSGVVDLATGVGAGLINLKFSRDHELEADRYGMNYMARAGYDPQAAVSMQQTLLRLAGEKRPGWLEGLLATHPPSQERVDANRATAQSLPGDYRNDDSAFRAALAPLLKLKPAYDAHDKGMKALAAKKPEEALTAANQAIKLEPREALFYALRGKAREQLGAAKEAEADYDEALRRNPNYFGPWLNRGKLRIAAGRTEAGEADVERSMTLLPTNDGRLALGKLAYADGRRERALGLLKPLAEGAGGDTGNSVTAHEAAALVTRMEMPRNPARHFRVERSLDPQGRLVLALRNRSPLAVASVQGVVAVAGRGELPFRSGRIAAGAVSRIVLDLRPNDLGLRPDQIGVAISGAQLE